MRRDPSVWLLLGLQFLLCFEWVHLDRSAERKPNLRPIYWDVLSYYAYLPALFIEDDLKLTFVEDPNRADVHLHRHRYWPETTPKGDKVIKTTMGVALMISPFFGVAHFLAPVLGQGWPFGCWWGPPICGITWSTSRPCRIAFRFFGCLFCSGVRIVL